MNRRSPLSWILGLCLVVLALTPRDAFAAAKRALFVSISGGYNADGVNMYNELNTYVTATHGIAGQVDYVLLNSDGLVARALAANTYEQIWVYDLSTAADNYPTDYQAILAWYNQAPIKEVICDGRYLSSFWSSRFSTEGRKVTQNYYYNLMIRGGGIVLATDHDVFANAGMNALANVLGIGRFTGNFGGSFPLNAGHPLTTEPNTLTSLFNDSSTSQAPFGLQPGGRTLRTIGYHSGNVLNPGISTTIDGGVLGITVEIAEDGDLLCEGSRTFNASITQGSEFGPFTYEWRLNNVVVGTGTAYTFDGELAGEGTYEVKVIAQGAGLRADDDIVTLTVGGVGCIRCGNEVIEEGESCDDGNTDDGDGCSADCLLEIGGGPCEGNAECVSIAICFEGICIPRCFGNVDCDDRNSCSSDLCDEETGICSNAFADVGATCDAGVCGAGGECVGCIVGAGPIDVGCSQSSPICLVGEGVASCVGCLTETDCPRVACAVSVCSAKACVVLPVAPTRTTCGEGTCANAGLIVCRNDELVVECEPRPDGAACDAGFCALAGTCDEGVCNIDEYRTCDDGNPCTADSCDEELGRCVNVPIQQGTACAPLCVGDVPPGTREFCDDLDWDCDGQTTNGFPVGERCNVVTGLGSCVLPGTWVCAADREGVICDTGDATCPETRCEVDTGRPCAVGIGACRQSGVTVCFDGDSDAVTCDAQPGGPSAEVCNGIDDDCNGVVDDADEDCSCDGRAGEADDCPGAWTPVSIDLNNNGIGDACECGARCRVFIDGCVVAGTTACEDGAVSGICRPALEALDESGQVREGFCTPEVCGVPEPVCDGPDTDGDGVPEGDGEGCDVCPGVHDPAQATGADAVCACENAGRQCSVLVRDGCYAGGVLVCAEGEGQARCVVDAEIDEYACLQAGCVFEGCDPVAERPCDALAREVCLAGVGACGIWGETVCEADGVGVRCEGTPGEPGVETCNGRDDDCDGETDEGVCPNVAYLTDGADGCRGGGAMGLWWWLVVGLGALDRLRRVRA